MSTETITQHLFNRVATITSVANTEDIYDREFGVNLWGFIEEHDEKLLTIIPDIDERNYFRARYTDVLMKISTLTLEYLLLNEVIRQNNAFRFDIESWISKLDDEDVIQYFKVTISRIKH